MRMYLPDPCTARPTFVLRLPPALLTAAAVGHAGVVLLVAHIPTDVLISALVVRLLHAFALLGLGVGLPVGVAALGVIGLPAGVLSRGTV